MPLRPNFIERLLIRWGKIPGPLLDMGLPSFSAAALLGAGEIELFREMDRGAASLGELADRTGSKQRALQNLLQVLEPLGYVEQSGGKYALSDYARKTVPVEIFHDMIPFFKEQMVRNVRDVGRALREEPEEGIFGWDKVRGGEVGRSYQVSMRWLAGTTVEEVSGKLPAPKGEGRMLDVGGSHGLYCVEMCRKNPELHATVFDWPVGIENARQTLEEESDVADRIDTLEGDFHHDDFPGNQDLVFLGNIIHGNSPRQNRDLFRRIAEATNPQGVIGIVDQFDNISGSQFTRSVASLIGWNLFLFANGRAYEVNQVKEWLAEAGFGGAKVHALRKSPGFTLLTARK